MKGTGRTLAPQRSSHLLALHGSNQGTKRACQSPSPITSQPISVRRGRAKEYRARASMLHADFVACWACTTHTCALCHFACLCALSSLCYSTVQYSKKAPAVRHCLFHCLSCCHHIMYPLLFSACNNKRVFFLSRVVHLSLGTPKVAHVFVMDVMMPGCMEE